MPVSSDAPTKFVLDERDIPTAWYNAAADLPFTIPPPIHPGTKKPLEPADLAPIFPMELIQQEMSTERWIEIPGEIRDVYRLWRPTPLKRARRFEKALGTRCRIYFKDESTSPVGSHKINTALAQAYYNKKAGLERLTTETGAGQWGTALELRVQRLRPGLPGLHGQGELQPEALPADDDADLGRRGLRLAVAARPSRAGGSSTSDPDCPGSLGIAISEAVEEAAADPAANYSLGSVLNHVLLHQTVIGLEAKAQLELAGDRPDVLVGCVGGGSNFGGLVLPFVPEKLARPELRIVGVEPTACPTMTRGRYAYDFGDTALAHPPDQDAHTWPRLHPTGNPRRRPALSRLLAAGQLDDRARPRRAPRRTADPRLRGRRPLRPLRGHRPRARDRARDRRRGRPGPAASPVSGASSSTSAATACSTWGRTRSTWTES